MPSRTAKFLCGAILASAAVYFVGSCGFKYMKKEIGTRIKYGSLADIASPAVTFCSNVPYKKRVLRERNLTYNLRQVINGPGVDNSNLVEAYQALRYRAEEMIKKIQIRLRKPGAGGESRLVMWERSEARESNFLELRPTRDYGNCFTTDFPDELDISIVLVEFDSFGQDEWESLEPTERGWVVYVHRRGQFHTVKKSLLKVVPGLVHIVEVKVKAVSRIPVNGVCSNDMDGGFDRCWTKGLRELSPEVLGCTYPWNFENLSLSHEDLLCKPAGSEIYTRNKENNLKDRLDNSGRCPSPCRFLYVSLGNPSTSTHGGDPVYSGTLALRFQRDAELVEEYLVYDGLSMMGEAGGYMGLFLGISFYQVLIGVYLPFNWLLSV